MSSAHHALAALPPERLRRLALRARTQMRNQALNTARMRGRLIGAGTAAVGAGIAGYIMGQAMADRDANAAAIEAGQMEDPTKIAGLDKDAVTGFVLTGLGIALQTVTKSTALGMFGEAVEGGGLGAFAYWIGSRAQELGYDARQQAPRGAPALG